MSASTLEKYFDAVYSTIKSSERPPHGVKLATLGGRILKVLPRWTEWGYPTLKALLVEMERQGRVKTGRDEKNIDVVSTVQPMSGGLSVLAATSGYFTFDVERRQAIPVPTPGVFSLPRADEKATPISIRHDVWTAFAITKSLGRRFVHRKSGEVRIGPDVQPVASDDWIEIQPIPDVRQRQWAQEFISEKGLDSLDTSVLSDAFWYTKLADRFRALSPELLGEWNRLRSARVTEIVARWCEMHSVSSTLLSDSNPAPGFRQSHSALRQSSDVKVRAVILRALERMTTDELAALPIPAKYILKECGL